MASVETLTALLCERIRQGDYTTSELPTGRGLAEEMGVSYLTARRALDRIVLRGMAVKRPNGRLAVNQDHEARPLFVAFCATTLGSTVNELLENALRQAAVDRGIVVRSCIVHRWDDPVLLDILEDFDGVFLSPFSDPMPGAVLQKALARRLVVFGDDYSPQGLPSLRFHPPRFVQRLMDHLARQGHRRIACLNTQAEDRVILERIGQWRLWLSAHNSDAPLINAPIHPAGDPAAAAYSPDTCQAAYRLMSECLRTGGPKATALFCTTAPAAIGAMRAMDEWGVQPGRDLAVCTLDGERFARYLRPSLTAMSEPSPDAYIRMCFDWMARPERTWMGPLLMEPEELEVCARESTDGPPPASRTPADSAATPARRTAAAGPADAGRGAR